MRINPSDILFIILALCLTVLAAFTLGGLAAHPFACQPSSTSPQASPATSPRPYRFIRTEGVAGTLSPGRFERASARSTPRPVANRPAQPSPAWRVHAVAAPTGAPGRR